MKAHKMLIVCLSVAMFVIACRDKHREQHENVSGAALTGADTVKGRYGKDRVSLPQYAADAILRRKGKDAGNTRRNDGTRLPHSAAYRDESNEQYKKDYTVAEAVSDITESANNDIDKNLGFKCDRSGLVEAIYARPFSYGEMKRADIDTSNLIGLFCRNDGCYLKPAKISFLDEWGECAMVPILTLKSDARFLFSNFINYSEGKIQRVPLKEEIHNAMYAGTNSKMMLLKEKFTFKFGDIKYVLETTEDGLLVFSIKGTNGRDTLVSLREIYCESIELLFIGDLDFDGKPDIILNAPHDYEDKKIILFLSSNAKEGKYLRCECFKFDGYGC